MSKPAQYLVYDFVAERTCGTYSTLVKAQENIADRSDLEDFAVYEAVIVPVVPDEPKVAFTRPTFVQEEEEAS